MSILRFALKNIRRKLFRSAALVLAVAFVAGLLFAGSIGMKGVMTSIILGSQRLGADLLVVPEGYEEQARTTMIAGKPTPFQMPFAVYEQVLKVKGVKHASPQLFLKAATFQCCTPVDAILIAFDPATDFTVGPWLKGALDRPLGLDEIVVGRSIPVPLGEQMRFYGRELTVVGFLADTGLEYIDHGVFMTFETARAMIRQSKEDEAIETLNMPEDAISAVLVQMTPEIIPERGAVFVEYEIDGVRAIASQDVIGAVKNQMRILLQLIAGIGVTLWIVTLVLITVVFSMIANERQREIGILRALGARRATIFNLITLEAMIVALVGGLLGIGAGSGGLALVKAPVLAAFKLPYLWPEQAFVLAAAGTTLLLAVITGVVAVFIPALRCSRMEPYAAIRQGE